MNERLSWRAHAAALAIFLVIAAALFPSWLRPYHLPQRGGPNAPFKAGDLTPLFYVWTVITQRSLVERGELPLWTDHIYCGEPFFAKAQIGVFSLTTALLFLLPAELVATWTFLLHLALGGFTTYAGALLLVPAGPKLQRWLAAVAAGAFYETCALLVEHTAQGHGPIVLTAAVTPFILALTWRAMERRHGWRLAAMAAALLAAQFLAGGATMTLYSGAALACLGIGAALVRRSVLPVLKVTCAAALAGGIAAVKLLPALSLMPVSNRAGGLAPQVAALPIIEFTPPKVAALLDPTGAALAGPWLAAALGLAGMQVAFGRRGRDLVLLATAAFGLVVATRPEVFAFMVSLLPGFQYQRIPQRALVLFYAAIALLVGGGAFGILRKFSRRISVLPVGISLVAAVLFENWAWREPPPPVRDIRHEHAANALFQYLAKHHDNYRIHIFESRDRNWGLEHLATPLGLETMVGWDHMWLLDFLGAEGLAGRQILPFVEASYRAKHPDRFWGMAAVRWITASRPALVIDGPDLLGRPLRRRVQARLVQRFPEYPHAQPPWSDGPFLHENPQVQPKCLFSRHAVVVAGPRPLRRWAVYRLLDELPFDPTRYVVVEIDSDQLPLVDSLPNVVARVLATVATTSRLAGWTAWNPAQEAVPAPVRKAVQTVMDRHLPSRPTLMYRRHKNWYRTVEGVPDEAGYVFLSEKFAHFPGWTAKARTGNQLRLIGAYGVFSAIPVGGGEQAIELVYRPPGFSVGFLISLLSGGVVLLAGTLEWRGRLAASSGPT